MDTQPSLSDLLARARAGNEDAAAVLVREYGPELHRFVRFRLFNPRLRRVIDSLDVCQSVLAAFFVSLREGKLELNHPLQLVRLLALMAEHKVKDKLRWQQAARRGGGVAEVVPEGSNADIAGSAPNPADEVADADLVQAIRDRLPEADRPAVDLWLTGQGWPEVGATIGATPEAARKRVSRAIDHAARELGLLEEKS